MSNLSYVGKLIERAAIGQMNEHMTSHDLHHPLQSAYRSFHSTETALLKILNDLILGIDDKKVGFLIMLDLSAAFDTVNHSMLLERLHQECGMNEDVLKWLKSYFSDRTQSVVINGHSSNSHALKTGMPQGSVMGPFCFPTYTSALFDIIQKHDFQVHMYADDTQIYVLLDPSDGKDMVEKLESCVSDVRDWMSNNFLKLNDSKTEFMIISGSRGKLPEPNIDSIKIGKEIVNPVPSAKNIGAIFDNHLTMELQVSNICRNCYISLRQISKIRSYLTKEACEKLVITLIASKLDSNNSLLIGVSDKFLKKLRRIQHNAARLITRSGQRESITQILQQLHWLPIKDRIDYKVALLTFKCIHGHAPVYLTSMLEKRLIRREGLRSGKEEVVLEEHCGRLPTYGDRAFSVYAPKLWNRLPTELRTATSTSTFKKNLKTHLFKRAFFK